MAGVLGHICSCCWYCLAYCVSWNTYWLLARFMHVIQTLMHGAIHRFQCMNQLWMMPGML